MGAAVLKAEAQSRDSHSNAINQPGELGSKSPEGTLEWGAVTRRFNGKPQ